MYSKLYYFLLIGTISAAIKVKGLGSISLDTESKDIEVKSPEALHGSKESMMWNLKPRSDELSLNNNPSLGQRMDWPTYCRQRQCFPARRCCRYFFCRNSPICHK